jgi:adenine/guanine phosphoribosyltransferase-like PRPP-binding protein
VQELLENKRILVADDARLSGGSIDAVTTLLIQNGLNVVAIASVLNEADPITHMQGIPYFATGKIPTFDKTEAGYTPRPETCEGIPFYIKEIV